VGAPPPAGARGVERARDAGLDARAHVADLRDAGLLEVPARPLPRRVETPREQTAGQ
jgi:hypothetical protein